MQVRLPWGVRTTTQVNWSSSRPFNITTGKDDNLDSTINDRPTFAALCSSPLISRVNGINCVNPSDQVIPRNLGEGPGQFSITMNLQKTVPLKHGDTTTPANRAGNDGLNGVNNLVEPQRRGGGFPGGGLGGQRGTNRGGFGGRNRGQQNGSFNQKNGPTVTFQIHVQNLLNHTQLNSYSGTMTSNFFGRASSARNPRQIEVGLRFNF